MVIFSILVRGILKTDQIVFKGWDFIMKSTGNVRGIDSLGRIVIPKSIRKQFGVIDNKDSFEIFVENDMIILTKYEPSCIFCDNVSDIVNFKGRKVCKECVKDLTK